VDGLHATVQNVDYKGTMGLRTLDDQLNIVLDTSQSTIIAAGGDSGSVVLNDNLQVVGLLFSTDAVPNPTRASANRIDHVLNGLGVTLCSLDLPQITNVNPASGSQAGGTAVTISGTGFTGATAVGFGPAADPNPTVVDDTQINAVSPPGVGTVTVTVTTPRGASPLDPSITYGYQDPVFIGGITPAAGQGTGGTAVTIIGFGFTGATTLTFDGNSVSFTPDTDFRITAVTPPGQGLVSVEITTPAGTSPASPVAQFLYLAPRVDDVSPTQGAEVGGDDVTITGEGFDGATAVQFGVTDAQSFLVLSDTLIIAVSPAGTDTVEVTVTGAGGQAGNPFGNTDFTFVP
jgi:hypothetical protein